MSTIGWMDLLIPLGLIALFVIAVLVIYMLLKNRSAPQRVEQMLEEVMEENRTELTELLEEFRAPLQGTEPPEIEGTAEEVPQKGTP